jgi:hypothetical protein
VQHLLQGLLLQVPQLPVRVQHLLQGLLLQVPQLPVRVQHLLQGLQVPGRSQREPKPLLLELHLLLGQSELFHHPGQPERLLESADRLGQPERAWAEEA